MQRKKEAGLVCCRALLAEGGVIVTNVETAQFRASFLAEKQKSSGQNRTFSKMKLLLRLAAFIDALLA